MTSTGADIGESAGEPILRLICGVFGCAPELAERIRSRGRMKDYRPRAYLVKCGDPVTVLFVIAAGLAQAISYSAQGQPILLHEFRGGDFFGTVGAPQQGRHEADVVAVSEVSSFLLDGRELALLAEQHGCIGLALLRVMIDRLQRTETRMYEHAALSSVGRIHAELLRQARQSSTFEIIPAPILSDLALRVSTSRETVSRTVNALERRGIIRRSADALTVVAPHRLEELIV
ncbi:MAG TPA: Crp/Fnr family transcriptional regulator [Allosphingosinicella sp.]|jgi:CRP-like cAMP-binding protein